MEVAENIVVEKRSTRKIILLVLTCVRYVFCILGIIWRFPIQINIGGGALVLRAFFLCMLFFFRTFSCIDFRYTSMKAITLMLVTLFILSTLLFGWDGLFLGRLQRFSDTAGLGSVLQGSLVAAKRRVIGSFFLHASLRYRWRVKADTLTNTRVISWWTYVREWSSVLAVLNAATLAAFVLMQFQQLPFSCDYLEEKSYVGVQAIQSVAWFLGVGAEDEDDMLTEEEKKDPQTVSARFSVRKAQLIDQIVNDRKVVNQGVCGYILDSIVEKYQNPAFQYSVAVLLMVLLTPFLSLLRFTLDIANVLVLRWLQLMGVYRREESLQRVEEVR